jgi:hypothetical protein
MDVLVRAPGGEEAVVITEATAALLRRLVVTLPAPQQTAFVLQVLPFLLALSASVTAGDADASSELVSSAQRQYTTALLGSVLVYLDKTSTVFADIGASEVVLRHCVDYALHSLQDCHGGNAAPLRSELGAPQLLALIINKVMPCPKSHTCCPHCALRW